MSAYLAGIGADPISVEQWEKENGALQKALKERIRTFPAAMNEKQLAEVHEAAAEYGRKAIGKYGGWAALIPWALNAVDTKSANQWVQKAIDEGQRWRNKIPLLGKPFVYQKGKNKEWQDAYNLVTRIYIESAGLIGQRIVKDEALRDLANNLNPMAPTNLLRIGLVVATVAAAGGYLLSKGHR